MTITIDRMKRRSLARLFRFAAGLPFATIGALAWAENFPNRAIRWIVSFAPGGSGDVLSRLLGPSLSTALNQPIVIENKTGASGNIGGAFVAQSPPDGYTIGFAYSGTYSINPSVYTNMPFTQSDFASIIWLSTVPMVIVVPTSLPVTSVTELIALAKARPGQLNYGSAGIGSINHLAGELFNMMSGTMISHVPYRGGSLATTALISGEIQLIFAEPASVLPFIESGRIRPIAVTSAKPSALLPGLPTVSASGVAGYDVTSWNGMLAPAGTPSHVIARLNTELNKIIANAEVRKRMLDLGFEPVGGSPERFQEHIRQETEKWAKVVKATGMKVE